jgi:hypothetical protein
MIEDNILKIGGNRFKYWCGVRIQKWGNRLIEKGRYRIITNPSCKLVNPFTLLINFTVDTNEKYQVVIQGDYKRHYKESEDYTPDITEKEMFMLINQSQKDWFKKTK